MPGRALFTKKKPRCSKRLETFFRFFAELARDSGNRGSARRVRVPPRAPNGSEWIKSRSRRAGSARLARTCAGSRARGRAYDARVALAATSAARVAACADGISRSPGSRARGAIRGISSPRTRHALDPGSAWLAFFETSRDPVPPRVRGVDATTTPGTRARVSIEARVGRRARSRDRRAGGVRRPGSVRAGAHRRCSYLEGGGVASHLLGRDRGDAGALEGGLVRADEGGGQRP